MSNCLFPTIGYVRASRSELLGLSHSRSCELVTEGTTPVASGDKQTFELKNKDY